MVAGVTNISLPIRDFHGETIAALTVPFLPMKDMTASLETAIEVAAGAAEQISRQLGYRGEGLSLQMSEIGAGSTYRRGSSAKAREPSRGS